MHAAFMMNRSFLLRFIFFIVPALLLNTAVLHSQTSVLTQHNNIKRTGWNNTETTLTQANVGSGNFGKLFSLKVDDQVYAQPLVCSNVSIGGGVHNIVIVATVNNTVYAFDADNASAGTPYWQVSLTYNPGGSNLYRSPTHSDITALGFCGSYNDFGSSMGIVGTPVIDSNNTMYVVVKSVTKDGLSFVQYLHEIDITTGAEKAGSPVLIAASVPGNGDGSNGGVVSFDAELQNQRPGLLLYKGVVYIAWASHGDCSPYHGWVMGYDAATLAQKYVYNATPNGAQAGIWMSGQGPAVDDSGFIYVTTGNGTTGVNGNANDTTERGESLLKLSTASGNLKAVDFFTPYDYEYLNDQDLDYGSDGTMLIPNTNLSLSGSKESYLYLVNDSAMGGYNSTNKNLRQLLNENASSTSYYKHIHGSPVYFQNSNNQEFIYAWAETGLLKQFPFNRGTGLFDTLNQIIGSTALPQGMPGAMLSVSSNGLHAGSGILWASHPINGDANQSTVPGILQAFSADDVSRELWNTNWDGARDGIGNFAKFVCPTIANGKVYMATFSKQVNVYGLNPPNISSCTDTLPAPWHSADIGYVTYPGGVCDNSGTFTITASGDDVWNTADAFHYVFQSYTGNNVQIIARVNSIANTDPWAKCGVMFRASLDAGAPNVFLAMTIGNGATFQDRLSQSGNSNNLAVGGITAPYWVTVIQNANKYVGYISQDGVSWNAVDSVTVALGAYPYVGLAYTTHNNGEQGIALVDNASVIIGSGTPIDITTFTGKNINNVYAQLNWTTAGELPGSKYVVERSGSTTDFTAIGTVKGKGDSSSANQYTFNDLQPLDGINYYELQEVESNGSFKYSNIVPVTFSLSVIDIYPNPATTQIFIRNNNNFTGGQNVTVEIINTLGQRMYEQDNAAPGIITVNIPTTFQNGMYVVKVINAQGSFQARKIFVNR